MSRYYRSILNVQATVPAFVPTDIAGCQLWLDAADDTTISIGTGVSQWDDKSGNARHATQATAASQPAYITAGKNGLNIVRFDGSNDGMEGQFATFDQMTLFVVFDNNTGTFGRVFSQVVDGESDDFTQGVIPILRNGLSSLASYSATLANFFNSTAYTNDYAIGIYERGAIDTSLTIQGTTSTRSNLAQGTVDRYRLGFNVPANGAMNGDIAEVVVYNKVLTAGEKTQVETYFTDKWGI